MNYAEIKPGDTVWATMGSYGWRAGTILCIGTNRVRLTWDTGRQEHGLRLPIELRHRDPRAKGKDKPRPPCTDETEGKGIET